jgi:hypothetical protein
MLVLLRLAASALGLMLNFHARLLVPVNNAMLAAF